MTERRYYGGVGARNTPDAVLTVMGALAHIYRHKFGLKLRSGGAEGADAAFANGANGDADIYIPWWGFKTSDGGNKIIAGNHPWLRDIAERLHPNWDACTSGARALLTRNGAIALGADPNKIVKSEFVIGWTEGGREEGGTGQMIRVCREYNIPFINLGDPIQWQEALAFMSRHSDTTT